MKANPSTPGVVDLPVDASPGSSVCGLDWYRSRYANSRAGTTEAFLSVVRSETGDDPYSWIIAAVPDPRGFVLDVAAGSAVLAERLPGARYLGIDISAEELALARHRRPGRWYVRADACLLDRVLARRADTVLCGMSLQLLCPMEQTLAAMAKRLRPGGTFVATVPDGLHPNAALDGQDRRLREAVMVALGFGGTRHPNAALLERLPALADRFGLRIRDDAHQRFRLPIRCPHDAWFVAATHAHAGSPRRVVAAAADVLLSAAPGEWAISIRRLVAVRDGHG